MGLLKLAAGIVFVFLAWSTFNLTQNYRKARKIGLPILISPIDPFSSIWSVCAPVLIPLLSRLPFGLGNFLAYSKYGWYYTDRGRLHQQLGPAFLIITPRGIDVVLGDGVAMEDVFSRRKDFIKPPQMYDTLNVFGPNVDSVNGDDWARHRKITSPPFNERNSALVWKESLRQAGPMLESWVAKGKDGFTNVNADTLALALHVLTAAGYGKSYDFGTSVSANPKGHSMSFEKALEVVLSKFVAVIISASIGKRWRHLMQFLPKSSVQVAMEEFQQYLREMVKEERMSMASEKRTSDRDNLMSAMLRASDLRDLKGDGRNTLSEEEIYGNLFIYTFAGHDTTAGTLGYAISLLAGERQTQDWLKEEIQFVIGENRDSRTWDYEEIFPRLKRCLALMYETLRLYGPVVMMPKLSSESPQTITIKGQEFTVPVDTYVLNNITNVHLNPEAWGPDPGTWRPERWLINTEKGIENEEIMQPPHGSFFPWASGPRVCPGKKFAQVEFVAVIAKLFLGHRVSPVLRPGETQEQARNLIHDTAMDSQVFITLKINHPEKLWIKWEAD